MINLDILCRKYYIVEFPEEEQDGKLPMAVVPSNWLQPKSDSVYCMWPNNLKGGNKSFNEAVETMKDITLFDFILCPIHIKYGSSKSLGIFLSSYCLYSLYWFSFTMQMKHIKSVY